MMIQYNKKKLHARCMAVSPYIERPHADDVHYNSPCPAKKIISV